MYKLVTVAALQAALVLPGLANAGSPTLSYADAVSPAVTSVAIVEFNLGSMNLYGENNDSDFDSAGAFVLDGQARARSGNFILEIQGVTTGSVDDGDDDQNSSSFGAYGHYASQVGNGTLAFAAGMGGGTNVEESDGAGYGLAALEYARGDWMVSIGHVARVYGQDSDDQVISFSYLQGAYVMDIAANTQISLGGYIGLGSTDDEDEPVSMYEMNATISQDFSDAFTGSFKTSAFNLSSERGTSTRAVGYDVSIGLSMAIGAKGASARRSIPFDIPSFHREFTWGDEIGL